MRFRRLLPAIGLGIQKRRTCQLAYRWLMLNSLRETRERAHPTIRAYSVVQSSRRFDSGVFRKTSCRLVHCDANKDAAPSGSSAGSLPFSSALRFGNLEKGSSAFGGSRRSGISFGCHGWKLCPKLDLWYADRSCHAKLTTLPWMSI